MTWKYIEQFLIVGSLCKIIILINTGVIECKNISCLRSIEFDNNIIEQAL